MNQLTFKNSQFKIMQIADAQEFPVVSPDTVHLIEMALAAERPDLVIFTGDQIYGIHPKLWGKAAEARITAVFQKLLAPIVAANVPFAVTFGNHDAECGVLIQLRQGAAPRIISKENPSWRPLGEEDEPYRRAIYLGEGCWERLETGDAAAAVQILQAWGCEAPTD